VTGATGYIGNSIAKRLASQGHLVSGLYRADSHLALLQQQEILPVKGTVETVDEWKDILNNVEVVIDTATSSALASHNYRLFQLLFLAGKERRTKKRYVYVSGCLVCGENNVIENNIKDEDDPLLNIHPNFIWRKQLEENLLSYHLQDTSTYGAVPVIVRPAFVFGGSGGHYATKWFEQGERNVINVIGNAKKRWGWVHNEDLAEALQLITESDLSLIANQIFHISDDSRYRFEEVVIQMGRAAGATCDVVYEDASNDPFHKFIDLDALVSSEKIHRLLGWKPRHSPFLDHVDLYYRAYNASKSHH